MSSRSRRTATAAPRIFASRPTIVSPDAKLICNAHAFIARQLEIERHFQRLGNSRTDEGQAEWYRLCAAQSTRFAERLDEISYAEPSTPEGLVAQALVVMFEFNEVDDDDGKALAWNLAESVLRIFGVPLPSWAASEAKSGEEHPGDAEAS